MSGMLEDDKAIRELISRYCFLVDRVRDRDADAFTAMFTEDGVWNSASLGMRVEGRKQLRDFIAGVYGSDAVFRHLIANAIISIDGDRATAHSYVHVSNLATGTPVCFMIAFYDDELVKQSGKWLFKVRNVRND
jgi:ketosteroid isomerase-like protein